MKKMKEMKKSKKQISREKLIARWMKLCEKYSKDKE